MRLIGPTSNCLRPQTAGSRSAPNDAGQWRLDPSRTSMILAASSRTSSLVWSSEMVSSRANGSNPNRARAWKIPEFDGTSTQTAPV